VQVDQRRTVLLRFKAAIRLVPALLGQATDASLLLHRIHHQRDYSLKISIDRHSGHRPLRCRRWRLQV